MGRGQCAAGHGNGTPDAIHVAARNAARDHTNASACDTTCDASHNPIRDASRNKRGETINLAGRRGPYDAVHWDVPTIAPCGVPYNAPCDTTRDTTCTTSRDPALDASHNASQYTFCNAPPSASCVVHEETVWGDVPNA